VAIFLGGAGVGFTGINQMFVGRLAQDGLEAVIVSWQDSWLQSAPGEEVGPARLACRSATAASWVHDNLYQELGAPKAGLGACGFCLHGNSGGASQVGYSLSLYGLGSIVDAAVMSGGPPHAALARGCLGEPGYAYIGTPARHIDMSYGFPRGGGPCERQDASFKQKWDEDSLETAGGVYKFLRTRIVFLFVAQEDTVGPAHGKVYFQKLEDAGSPNVISQTIPGTQHEIEYFPAGQDALEEALLASVG
jgi:hypothetical protein